MYYPHTSIWAVKDFGWFREKSQWHMVCIKHKHDLFFWLILAQGRSRNPFSETPAGPRQSLLPFSSFSLPRPLFRTVTVVTKHVSPGPKICCFEYRSILLFSMEDRDRGLKKNPKQTNRYYSLRNACNSSASFLIIISRVGKKPLRSLSPTVNLAQPSSPLKMSLRRVYTSFK